MRETENAQGRAAVSSPRPARASAGEIRTPERQVNGKKARETKPLSIRYFNTAMKPRGRRAIAAQVPDDVDCRTAALAGGGGGVAG